MKAYDEHALSEPSCREWFRNFKSGDFSVEDKERPDQPKKFEDEELEEIISQDQCQTLQELSESLNVDKSAVNRLLHSNGLVQKLGDWVPHELTERAIANRLTMSELLLQKVLCTINSYNLVRLLMLSFLKNN